MVIEKGGPCVGSLCDELEISYNHILKLCHKHIVQTVNSVYKVHLKNHARK